MHLPKGAWRVLIALALVTFALLSAVPLATPTVTHAQTPIAPSSITTTGGACVTGTSTNCYVSVNPGLAFNVVGTSHTVVFTCGAAVGPAAGSRTAAASTDLSGNTANATQVIAQAPAPVIPGCYDVSASVTDESNGTAATFTFAQCGENATTITGSTVNCASYASPLCPVGAVTSPTAGAFCSIHDTNSPRGSQLAVSINPGAPHAYLFTFTGYTPLLATCDTITGTTGQGKCTSTVPGGPTNACPVGFTYKAGPFNLTTNSFVPPLETTFPAPGGVCAFTLTAEKKYLEITSLTLTPPAGSPCSTSATPTAQPLTFAEGLKSFFGPPCTLVATATGVVIIKSGISCASEPANGTAVSPQDLAALVGTANPGIAASYQCTGDTLSIVITGIQSLGGLSIPIVVTATNGGVTLGVPTPTLGTLCTGQGSATTLATFTGTSFTVCPTGPGTGTVKACAVSPIDTQPGVCSNVLNFNFIVPNQQRVVPYVRWSGEKQVLTKCFGGAGLFGGSLVEFTLEGGGADTQATLIPASLGGTVGSPGGSEPIAAPSQNTVITVTDADGCATVIVYATGEGVVNVDAAIFSTAPTAFGTVPLLNEHAFEIFYLKFDHVDLENIKQPFATVTANPFTALGFTSAPAPFVSTTISGGLPNAPGTNPPSANGYSIPLCQFDYMRAWVHGYFEWTGDPSGRPATTVGISGAPSGAATSYVLPAGRWVLPEDWPVLATFAGFTGGNPNDTNVSSIFAWDLNSGWVFNQGGENPLICAGPNPVAPPATSTGAISVANTAIAGCYGQDAAQKAAGAGAVYTSAPLPNATLAGADNCVSGNTVGIGPFDPTQACTTPFPLTYSPAGSSILTGGAGGAFAIAPLSQNSTYLPNATLNEWDAPMPPAQVQFSITGGPGFLAQVNKTGLYHLDLLGTSGGSTSVSATTCTAANFGVPAVQFNGSATANGTCNVGEVYPDPFYSEAIPASPLIPPVTNNGGYLWDTFGFRGGTILGPTTTAGSIAGLLSTVDLSADPCQEATTTGSGFTFIPGAASQVGHCFVGAAGIADTLVTLAECDALRGVWTQTNPAGSFGIGSPATGTCEIPIAPATAPGGINLTNFGNGCPTFAGLTAIPQYPNPPGTYSGQVEVADATGYVAGGTVSIYNSRNGAVIASGLTVTSVTTPGPDVVGTPNVSGILTLGNVPAGLCVPIHTGVFVSDQVAVTVPASNTALNQVTPGAGVGLTTSGISGGFNTNSTSTTVFAINGNVLFLGGSSALAQALGACVLLTIQNGIPTACAVNFLPVGTIITLAPSVGIAPIEDNDGTNNIADGPGDADTNGLFSGQGPYPFWQWVPNASTGAASSATMYSDNHGEAIVSLQTGVAAQVAPVAGACPAGYTLTPAANNCLLNLAGLTSFQNIKAIGSAAGCIATTAAGANTPVPAATPATGTLAGIVGGTGPAAGQICINNLGGIEFGSGATLGVTTVQAIADYPYSRVHPAISSGAINKVFTSAFAKTLSVSQTPVAGPSGTSSYTVTIMGTDICGNPIFGEPVNVFALTGAAGAVVLAPQGLGGTSNGTSAATVQLDGNGSATLSLEVLNQALGNAGLVIKAVFPLEKVERFVTVIAGTVPNQSTTQIYPPGYNMVGGPAGTNFGSAEALFTFDPTSNTYSSASSTNVSSAAPTCVGYYAYFASATTVSFTVTSKAGDTATCQLNSGWNLVGNPFGSAAQLPSGVTAYHYNPTGQTYDLVSSIPLGGAVFIYEAGPNTITLTAT